MDCHKYKVVSIELNRLTYECHGFQYDMFKFPLKLPELALTCLKLLVQWIKEIFFPSYLTKNEEAAQGSIYEYM